MTSTDLTHTTNRAPVTYDAEQINLIRTQICPDLNDGELGLFLQVCQRTGLDPFAKQIYAIKRAGRMTLQVSIDGFRLIAQRSDRYLGQTAAEWYDGERWHGVWIDKDPPKAARIGVYMNGAPEPTWGIATFQEFVQKGRDGKPMGLWKTMAPTMLAKCAESQALRKAFPAELGNLYTPDELAQAENVPEPLTDQQADEIRALSKAAGVPKAAAEKRLAAMTAADYADAVTRLTARIEEQEPVDAVTVEPLPDEAA